MTQGSRQRPSRLAADPNLSPRAVQVSRRQAVLWEVDRLLAGTSHLNRALAWQIRGPLDTAALAEAIRLLCARHRILATAYPDRGGAPIAVLVPPCALQLSDLRDAAPAESEALVEAERGRPFDVAEEPLFRAVAIRTSEQEHVLVLVVHLLVCDRASFQVLARDLGLLYDAVAAGGEAALALPLQYDELAARTAALEDRRAADVAYWRRRLGGARPVELPDDLRGAGDADGPPTAAARTLSPDTVRTLEEVGRARRTTFFAIAASALLALVHGRTRQPELLLATAVDNRLTPETAQVVGPLSGGLLLRIALEASDGLADVAGRVHRATLEGLQHQTLPFDDLVELLERDGLARTELARLSLDVHGADPVLRLRGLDCTLVETGSAGASWPAAGLHVTVRRGDSETRLELLCDPSRFAADRAEELAFELEDLLERCARTPDAPVRAADPVPM